MKKYKTFLKSSKSLFDDHYGFKKKGKSLYKKEDANPEERPYSLTRSLKKGNKITLHNGSDLVKVKSKEEEFSEPDSPLKTLKNSCEKFPSIEKNRTAFKMPCVCPIISESQSKNLPIYKTRKNFINAHN